tara:strand:- start:2409 stop:3038 length:630 start_codon:yes stop_codon:yes gene_type:complete
MLKRKFCIVGVDNDIQDFIFENKRNYLGLVSNLKGKNYKFGRVIGGENLSDWLKIKKKYNPDVFILIDEGKVRERLYEKIFKNNLKNLIIKKSYIDKSVIKYISKKRGIFIQKLCFISSNVNIGDGVKINVGAQIHHDVSIEKYCTIAPRAVILGSVKIGKYTYIGANSTIKQNVKIGKNVIIGAGAVVVKDIKNNQIVAGNPAKEIKS